jgi:hypothetical protein
VKLEALYISTGDTFIWWEMGWSNWFPSGRYMGAGPPYLLPPAALPQIFFSEFRRKETLFYQCRQLVQRRFCSIGFSVSCLYCTICIRIRARRRGQGVCLCIHTFIYVYTRREAGRAGGGRVFVYIYTFINTQGSRCLTHFFPNSEKMVPSIPACNYSGNRPSETLC